MIAVIVVSFTLWVIGVATSHMFGGLIHLFLGIAIAALLRVIDGKRPEPDWPPARRDKPTRGLVRDDRRG